jgi:hypothetical protein
MESIVKLDQPISPLLDELLGESNLRKPSLGIEDTKSLWASLRSKVNPVVDDWLPAKDEILENISLVSSIEVISAEESNIIKESEPDTELYTLLNEATLFLKEELGIIKSELSNIHLYKGAIQSLSAKISDKDVGYDQIKSVLESSEWVVGSKFDQFEEKFEIFKDDLPRLQKGANENILEALKEFEEKCLRLGATQLDSLLSIKGQVGSSKVEELQETLMYLISGQKRILESISDIMNGLRSVSGSVASLPSQEMIENLGERQEEKIELFKLELVGSRIEERLEEQFLKKAVIAIGVICLFTFSAILYSLV